METAWRPVRLGYLNAAANAFLLLGRTNTLARAIDPNGVLASNACIRSLERSDVG